MYALLTTPAHAAAMVASLIGTRASRAVAYDLAGRVVGTLWDRSEGRTGVDARCRVDARCLGEGEFVIRWIGAEGERQARLSVA